MNTPTNPPKKKRAEIWAFGGGKGGIGKSFLCANIGITLAQLGYRTLLADFDLGGANLHTWLGLPVPKVTLSDFLVHRGKKLKDLALDTNIRDLWLLNGANDMLGIANLKHLQKMKLLRAIRRLDYDYVLLDLGGGSNFNTIDFFLAADRGIIVLSPEPVAIENAYRFLKTAFYRNLKDVKTTLPLKKILTELMDNQDTRVIRTPMEMLAGIEQIHPGESQKVLEKIQGFQPNLLINQLRERDDQEIAPTIVEACRRFFGITMHHLGDIPYDEAVWRSVRAMEPLAERYPQAKACLEIMKIVKKLGSP